MHMHASDCEAGILTAADILSSVLVFLHLDFRFTSCQCRQAGRRLRVFRGMRAPNKSDSFVAISVGRGNNLIKLFTTVIYE